MPFFSVALNVARRDRRCGRERLDQRKTHVLRIPKQTIENAVAKELCKIQDDLIRRDLNAYKALVSKPKHVCKKCGRVANKKKSLCKPTRLKKSKQKD